MKQILLVEDTPVLAEEVADILQMENYFVCTAANGRQALEFLRKSIPDLIITDLLMPEIDGFDLIKAIRQDQVLREIPVIVLSAKIDDQTIEKVRALGINEFLKKPCRPFLLLRAVDAVLRK